MTRGAGTGLGILQPKQECAMGPQVLAGPTGHINIIGSYSRIQRPRTEEIPKVVVCKILAVFWALS